MAVSVHFFLASSLLLIFVSPSIAQQSFRPRALVVPVSKDASTLQYVTQVEQRTPLVPINLVVHLGGKFLWIDCEQNYVSSTYRPARCGSALCSLGGSDGCGDCFSGPRPGCNNNTCGVSPDNPFTNTATGGELATDVVSVNSTNGSNPGRAVTVPRFLFACAPTFLLQGLATGAVGIAGLGRNRAAFPSQFASAFSLHRKFAICLGSVQVSDDVLCLGLIDGGSNPRTSIVIGGYQVENNLLQFDLATSRLGFSSLLFGRMTTCANFNFTSVA
ncbi:conserved hypothetical protein [Ricinus communis]|uniref:Xylanase inhibitor N-terminal domain-containing protein n=1 Tax=Ricinus communis TaxID=3988 RepID=B9S447_RICCO|nr:conserved hypothetical protein [Ricinus communis]